MAPHGLRHFEVSVHKSVAKSSVVQVIVQLQFFFLGHSCRNDLAVEFTPSDQ